MLVLTKTFMVGTATAFAPGHSSANQVAWLASAIVHDACHSVRFWAGQAWQGKVGEVACLEEQLAAMDLIGGLFSNYLRGLIEGADDPENQYWNDPNRHW